MPPLSSSLRGGNFSLSSISAMNVGPLSATLRNERPTTAPPKSAASSAAATSPSKAPLLGMQRQRPAREAANSARVHGTWVPSGSAGAWSTGANERPTTQSGSTGTSNGPRISEPVRVEVPSAWGAPAHRPTPSASASSRPSSGISAARGTNKLQDYSMLAAACHRAGRMREEAVAQYCSGVILDNSGQRGRAINCYKRMLAAAEGAEDTRAAMVAHNRLGVNLQSLGHAERAMMHHEAHRELADTPGRFVAHLNLGLAQSSLGQLEEAAVNFRHALRHAIRSGSMHGEAVACGNLALVGKLSGDVETARACLDRYLQLTEALSDSQGAVEAHQRLGDLAAELGDLEEAGAHFESALSITASQPDAQAALNATKVEIGLAQGNLQFTEWMLESFPGAGGS